MIRFYHVETLLDCIFSLASVDLQKHFEDDSCTNLVQFIHLLQCFVILIQDPLSGGLMHWLVHFVDDKCTNLV